MSDVVVRSIERPLPEGLETRRKILLEQLAELHKSYQKDAEPIIKHLAKIEGFRPPPYIFIDSGPPTHKDRQG